MCGLLKRRRLAAGHSTLELAHALMDQSNMASEPITKRKHGVAERTFRGALALVDAFEVFGGV